MLLTKTMRSFAWFNANHLLQQSMACFSFEAGIIKIEGLLNRVPFHIYAWKWTENKDFTRNPFQISTLTNKKNNPHGVKDLNTLPLLGDRAKSIVGRLDGLSNCHAFGLWQVP
jgi:hypothetical protein